ncbi:MAG: twin-arginine translocase subunit TatC [Anaerolineaceae bacterium]|nr:twin-arginine translocase subunit TatC [Anaerolineaceae bacterium]
MQHKNENSQMSLYAHLEELRHHLLLAMAGLGLAVLISFIFTPAVINFLAMPVGGVANLQAIDVTETIQVYMKVALLCGVILSSPWIFYQLFLFIGKGLTEKEKRSLLVAIPFVTLLFAGGAVFAFFIMLPPAMTFFSGLLNIQTVIRIRSYFDFTVNLIFWIAVSFEIPLIFYILARFGFIKAAQMTKGWRIAVVGIAVLAAVITPTPDPVNMAIFMIPLFGLYLLSILLVRIAAKNRATATEE